MPVFSVSGRRIGSVIEARESCFQVGRDKRDGGDICLQNDSIFTVEDADGVTLMCAREEVERYRCGEHLV